MKSNWRPVKPSSESVEPNATLFVVLPSPLRSMSALAIAHASPKFSCPNRWMETFLPAAFATSRSLSEAIVTMPKVPHAQS